MKAGGSAMQDYWGDRARLLLNSSVPVRCCTERGRADVMFIPLVVLQGAPRAARPGLEPMGFLEWHLMRASEVPFAALIIVVGAGVMIWCLYKIVEVVVEDIRTARQARAEDQNLLAEVEVLNQEIIEQIQELTALARRQLAGETIAGEAESVREGFERIEEVVEEYSKSHLRTWVKAVTDRYRFTVRRLVESIDNGEDPVIAAEVLEDTHRMTVVDLQVKQMRDGRAVIRFPRNPDGTPFDLQRAQAEYKRSQARLTEEQVSSEAPEAGAP